jgi:hypothetical protein
VLSSKQLTYPVERAPCYTRANSFFLSGFFLAAGRVPLPCEARPQSLSPSGRVGTGIYRWLVSEQLTKSALFPGRRRSPQFHGLQIHTTSVFSFSFYLTPDGSVSLLTYLGTLMIGIRLIYTPSPP